VAYAIVDNRFESVGKIFEGKIIVSLMGEMSAGAEEPLKIAQDALAITLESDDPLGAALVRIFGVIIGEPVEEAGL